MSDKRTCEFIFRPLSVTFVEAKRYSGIPARTLRDAQKTGKLIACRYGGGRHKSRWVIRLDDLDDYLRSLHVVDKKGGAS